MRAHTQTHAHTHTHWNYSPKVYTASVSTCTVRIVIWNRNCVATHGILHFQNWLYFVYLITTQNEKSITELYVENPLGLVPKIF